MPATEAQIRANQINASKSTGPKTEEGKARSRANALKHGLTGEGVVLLDQDIAEINRLSESFRREFQAEGDLGQTLAHRMAVMAVRMDRSVEQETAALSDRVNQALDDFEAPEGVSPEEADRLRVEAGRRAMFDPSKEASLARKYEAAAERCFFRSMNELRQLKKETARSLADKMVAEAQASMARLGSFSTAKVPGPSKPAPAAPKPLPVPAKPVSATLNSFEPTFFEVPISIGRAR